jgi:hypothetical protein
MGIGGQSKSGISEGEYGPAMHRPVAVQMFIKNLHFYPGFTG